MGISSIRVYIIDQNVLSGQFRAPVPRATLRARARAQRQRGGAAAAGPAHPAAAPHDPACGVRPAVVPLTAIAEGGVGGGGAARHSAAGGRLQRAEGVECAFRR